MNSNTRDGAAWEHRASSSRRPARGYEDSRRWSAPISLRIAAAGTICGFLLLAGCAKSASSPTPSAPGTPTAAKPREERRTLTGEVLRIDAERKVLVIHHDEIKDYMPAMTMEFSVSAGDLAVVKPGMKVRGEMLMKNGDLWLEKIWPNDKAVTATIDAGANQLRQDTHTRGKSAYREVGETVPDFSLYDQTGRVAQANRFRGKQVMLNFIYTRCPIATMCPASTAKMVEVQKIARSEGVENLELISITMEPSYDTPGVLTEYAQSHGIDTSNFSLLTGPETAIKDLLAQFGILTEFEGDIIKHTLATLLIDENGKIIHRADGPRWEPREFVAKMKRT